MIYGHLDAKSRSHFFGPKTPAASAVRKGHSSGVWQIGAALTIILGIIYVSFTWTPSHYGFVLSLIGAPQLGPTLGTARGIRSDEFYVLTPYFQIAVANGLRVIDQISPYHELLRGYYTIPTNNLSVIFKPQLWGFLVAPPEYAYSYYHFFIIAAFWWGFSLLFVQLGLSRQMAVLGAGLLFFSAFTQGWWGNNGPIFAFTPWPLVATLVPGHWYARLLCVFYAAAVWFFSSIYIPFMIAAAFGLSVLFIALRRDALNVRTLLPAGLAALAATSMVVVYQWDLFSIMSNTVFPGSRVSAGGGMNPVQMWSHLFPYIARVQFEPTIVGSNECEVGTVASYLPLLILVFAEYRSLQQILRMHWWPVSVLCLGILLALAWLTLPVPSRLGSIFLWNRVPPYRLLWGFGLLATFAAVWIGSLMTWRVSPIRVGIFLIIALGAWIGVKGDAAAKSWFDGVIIAAVIVVAALLVWFRTLREPQRLRLLMTSAALTTNILTFGTFNPLQSARPIFHPPHTRLIEGLQRLAAAHPNGWVAVPGFYGAALVGLGLPAINDTLLEPQMKFFQPFFPDMLPAEFNILFNRYEHISLGPVGKPTILNPDLVQLPVIKFGTPLNATLDQGADLTGVRLKGQIESVEFERDKDAWKLWLEGWAPFEQIHPDQSLQVIVPEQMSTQIRSVRAVRNVRPDLVIKVSGGDYLTGGFILEVNGVGIQQSTEALARAIRVVARDPNGMNFELGGLPSGRVEISSLDGSFPALPARGNIDSIQLTEKGSVLEVSGWISDPSGRVDKMLVATNVPAEKAEIHWRARPDVVADGAANYLLVGFTIQLRLSAGLRSIPPNLSLCVVASSNDGSASRVKDYSKTLTCRQHG